MHMNALRRKATNLRKAVSYVGSKEPKRERRHIPSPYASSNISSSSQKKIFIEDVSVDIFVFLYDGFLLDQSTLLTKYSSSV